MIPLWKLKRELLRLIEQIRNLPLNLIEPAQRWQYDRNRWSQIKVHGTATTTSQKYCVLLIYQPGNIAKSLLTTCNFMATKGYNVLVVANGGLTDESRILISPHVWRVLERPNFGYDFGGFRDAIHFLNREAITPEFLILMNDSVWFPMCTETQVIERLEASEHDVTGLLLHVPSRNEFGKQRRRVLKKRKLAEHIESYITMVSRATACHEAFRHFWKDYPQTSSKTLTIRRGEIGFSVAMAAAGISVGALSRRKTFLAEIETRPDAFLEKTLQYSAYSDAEFEIECRAILASGRGSDWREKALDHIRSVVQKRRFNASFAWATEQLFATTFVKKHPNRLFQIGRLRFLEAVDNGDIPSNNHAALEELRTRVACDLTKTKKGFCA